jgi:hypothetical protein
MSVESHTWHCTCCGKQMTGLPPAMAFKAPGNWLGLDEDVKAASHFNSDFCQINRPSGETERYIRCVLRMPIAGAGESEDGFEFGVWMSVSEESWNVYRSGCESGVYQEEGCFGFLGNTIPEFPETFGLRADVVFEAEDQRPSVWLHNQDHCLVDTQEIGIELKVIEKLAVRMHN